MRFGTQVVKFTFQGIPMVGNMDNGYVIGLTDDGYKVCQKMFKTEITEHEIRAVDDRLFFHLECGGFFSDKFSCPYPTVAYFHITQECNLHCVGCYSYDSKRNSSTNASFEKIARALDQLASCGIKRLVISGGEPFLRKDLPAILKHAKTICKIEHIDVLTNGTVVSSKQLESVASFVDRISVSFDGYSEGSISHIRGEQRFEKLTETINMIKEAGIHAHLLPTIHAKNYMDIQEYCKLASELDVTLSFSLFSAPPGEEAVRSLIPTEKELERIAEQIIRIDSNQNSAFQDIPVNKNLAVRTCCGAARGEISVAYDGSVYPCHMLHDNQFFMGSLFDDGFQDVLSGSVRKEFITLNAASFKGCTDCEVRFLCGGGCRARSFYTSGSVYDKDPYCTLIKEFYKALFQQILTKN